MAPFIPGFVSEFPDQPVTDCVPASGLMLVNKVTHNRYPSSIAEREALQNAMGTQDEGATVAELITGIQKRYGLTLPAVYGWTNVAAVLSQTNKGVVIFGEYPNLPVYIREQGNQPTFNDGHAIVAFGIGNGLCIVGDPLASHYSSYVPIGDLRAFAESTNWGNVVGTEQSATIVGYRAYVGPGPFTAYHVMRFTHIPYWPKTYPFAKQSWARVKHGAPGFWQFLDGYFQYRYAVYGRSPVFTVYTVYSDSTMRKVSAAS